jgi:hypothetical protein
LAAALLAVGGCAASIEPPADALPTERVLIVLSDAPSRLGLVDHTSTGRSVAFAIGSALPVAGLLADAAATGLADRGSRQREEALDEAVGGYDPGERLTAELTEAFVSAGFEVVVLDDMRRAGPGEALVDLRLAELGFARADKEAPFAPHLEAKVLIRTPGHRRSYSFGCGEEDRVIALPCSRKTFGDASAMAESAPHVRRSADEGVDALTAELVRLLTELGTGSD